MLCFELVLLLKQLDISLIDNDFHERVAHRISPTFRIFDPKSDLLGRI